MSNLFQILIPEMLILIIPVTLEIISIRDCFDLFCPRKKINSYIYELWCLIATTLFVMLEYSYVPEYGKIIIRLIILFITVKMIYDAKTIQKMLVVTVSVFLIDFFFYYLGDLVLYIERKIDFGIRLNSEVLEFYTVILIRMIQMLLIKIIKDLLVRRKTESFAIKDTILLLSTPITSIIMLFLLYFINIDSVDIHPEEIYLQWCIVFINIVTFRIMKRMRGLYENEKSLIAINSHMKSDEENMKAVKETHFKIRSLAHGITTQLFAVEILLKNKRYQEAERYLSKITETVEGNMLPIHTNNLVIDALLNQKYIVANSKKIKLNFNVQDLEKTKIEDNIFVTILSNALNNAIEACDKIKPGKERLIDVNIINEEHEMIISIENTIEKNVKIIDGQIKTSKRNKEQHGYGISSIATVVKENNGTFFIESNEHTFKLLVIFK
ncbi:MAG: GHKL domain-containing protein [Clostridia bacterium]|nr:GHKL domain-containing protein [Clostridia bacterium]